MIQMNCQGLALGYSSALVRDLSFTVSAGDYLCILGENGVGKSTLMKTVLGLQIPLEGSVTLSGGVHSNEIGYLPQQTQAQRDFPATVWEVVLSGCQSRCGLRPFYTKAEKELARQSLRRMNMERFSKRCYRELSGGQQQRVLLARALCAARKMLLLDEPSMGLSPLLVKEIFKIIRDVNRNGVTVLLVEQNAKMALEIANRAYVLETGTIKMEGEATELANNIEVRKAYLGAQ